jgi:hypothetical protein
MKKLLYLFALLLTHPLFGFHAGIGFGWNTIDETFKSTLATNQDRSGKDRYDAKVNRLAPMIMLGHQFCLGNDWVAGFSAAWKYLNYTTPIYILTDRKGSF